MKNRGHPQSIGWLLVAVVAAVALAGCTGKDGAGDDPSPVSSPPPSSPPSTGSVTPPTGTASEFDVDVTESGFVVQDGRSLRVKQGDEVRITLHHNEPYGDDHPIYFTCTGRAATVTATGAPAVMAFVAGEAGTCAFFCTNGDCGPHGALQDGKLIVEA